MVLFSIFVSLTCFADTGRFYDGIGQLKLRIIGNTGEKIYVVFSAPMETYYYSPGVNAKLDRENNMTIEFVRSSIHEKNPPFDIKADYLKQWLKEDNISSAIKAKISERSNFADQIFAVPGTVKNIYVVNGKNRTKVWSNLK